MRKLTEAEYDKYLDEIYEPYKMGEFTFLPSDILKSCDPIAYRWRFNDYENLLESEAEEDETDESED